MLGLPRGTIRLFPHEQAWEREAQETAALLRRLLGTAASDIRHVGSTAIRHIAAKPIVDLAVAAPDFGAVLAKRALLQAHGFYYRESGIPNQLLFACGSYYRGEGDLQTHFIHVVGQDSAEWQDYLGFRDYLNAFPAAAKEYETLKFSLAAACANDPGRERYVAGKTAFVRYTVRKARALALLGKTVEIVFDRPAGFVRQTAQGVTVYPINYGYLPGVPGGDGEEMDAYLLGVDRPLERAAARVVGIVHRRDDNEDKLLAALPGARFTKEEMARAVAFQEQWYQTAIQTEKEAQVWEKELKSFAAL